ncbi:hypothetical protein HZS_6308 [Henneguya salminicola]|uniref:Phosphatidylinositol 4-kinase type 2 n=1 Tax=Henneguya salminicola TaxID=69463 RepID=A0A6G3MGX7_HENSL|nr:hypothetical protein HZS_6308 [Henneguya salminicola]
MLEQQPLIAKNKRQKKARKLPDSQNLLQFKELINSACEAINTGIYPSLIYAGSSGSYFVFNMEHQTIGVFKPKNEEPYGKLNPKWLKWLHRIFLPCCFGRSCIIPNKGYLSEAGAYLVDQFLDLQVVPPTFITFLISPTFNYSRIDRSASQARKYLKSKFNALGNINSTLPPKIGSFQKYVEGYSNAYTYFERLNNEPLPPEADNEFHYILEKVIVLDYIIRNTDRSDNWLMKLDTSTVPILSDGTITEEKKYLISVAAIDNGLAFPYKHPDSWRSCKIIIET